MTKSKDNVEAKVVSAKTPKVKKTVKASGKSAEQIMRERNVYRNSAHTPKARTAGGAVK